ncbi:MAG: ATP-binding protein [Deltaproteobacteria bacterium]|nr:ATP-binding protein [Deltaproteobacteria bacterium]
MEDLSLHILDIVENGTRAGATLVDISITEDASNDLLSITVRDNGRGMRRDMAEKTRDPFVTTRTTRRVGMGLSLLHQAAQEAGGDLSIESEPDRGTCVCATFQASHIDRKPLGDMGSTMITLILGNPDVDFVYHSDFDGEETRLDTREIRAELEEPLFISHPAVLNVIRDLFNKDPGKPE